MLVKGPRIWLHMRNRQRCLGTMYPAYIKDVCGSITSKYDCSSCFKGVGITLTPGCCRGVTERMCAAYWRDFTSQNLRDSSPSGWYIGLPRTTSPIFARNGWLGINSEEHNA